MSSENCTYFESNNPTAGGCSAKICPCNSNICQVYVFNTWKTFNVNFLPFALQLRLDFSTFSIAGPSTSANVVVQRKNGVAVENGGSGAPGTLASQCLTDSFSVTNAAGRSSDILCGVNTGQHRESWVNHIVCFLRSDLLFIFSVYVETNSGCTDLNFILGSGNVGVRLWSIKVQKA